MHQQTIFSQAIRYQKTISKNAFSLLSEVQRSGAEMLEQSLDHCSWLPVSGKKSCLYWSERCIQATEQLRSIIDKGFEEAEKQLSTTSPDKAKPKAASKPLSSGQQTVKAPVQISAPVKSPSTKSVDAVISDAPKDSGSPSLKQLTAAQRKTTAAKKASKAATRSKSAATRAKSTSTKAEPATTKAKSTKTKKTGTAATVRKSSTAKSKSPAAASSTAVLTKAAEKLETSAEKTATKTTAAPASKQPN